ncbi:MAG: acyltransferase family protein [Ramlibacter sp.]|nr:acyltransferase family protein [Ramlibacter sp.]
MADASGERVLGWDVLRGLSAFAVAIYHLLYWQGVASVHTLGSYGVYLFFVLSGASLAYTYAGRLEQGRFSYRHFLWVRYIRLAPLYLALIPLLPWQVTGGSENLPWLWRWALNASFLFGFFDPAQSSLLVGGWSLGIEAIYYLIFPLLLMMVTASRWLGWASFVLLIAVQAAWIARTVGGPGGYAANLVAYHQVPAFAAYFMAGCLIGCARRRGRLPAWPNSLPLLGVTAGFVLLCALNPTRDGDQLIGWRGAACAGLCLVMAWLAGGLELQDRGARAAAHMGDATYGLYLMHPILFFWFAMRVVPALRLEPPERWPLGSQLGLTAAVLALAFALALFSERYFERPLRNWSKARTRA